MHPPDSPEVLEFFHRELGLVDIVARQVMRKLSENADFEELRAAGREGLLMAARRFDPTRGVPFRSFANYRVQGAIYDALRRILPLSRGEHSRLKAYEAAAEVGRGSLGWTDNAALAASPAAAESALDAQLAAIVTSAAISFVSDSGRPEPASDFDLQDTYEHEEALGRVRDALAELGNEEAQIVRLHYFEGQSFTDIARALNISKAWTSRLHARAMARLSERFASAS